MTSDNGSKTSVAVESAAVANKFVSVYYPTIRADPKKTHQFYMDDSKFTRIEDNKEPNVVVGQQNIYEVLETISYERIVVDHVDSQQAPNGGVLIVVTGRIKRSEQGAEAQDFVQTFVLGPLGSKQGKTRQYYVCNDVLRYLSRQKKTRSESISIKTGEEVTKGNEETQKAGSEEGKDSKPSNFSDEPAPEVAAESKGEKETAAKVAEVENSEKDGEAKKYGTVKEEKGSRQKQPKAAGMEAQETSETAKADAPVATAAPAPSSKKAKSGKRKPNGKWDNRKNGVPSTAPPKAEQATQGKEAAQSAKTGTKSTWAMRMRDSQARAVPPATNPAVAAVEKKAVAEKPAEPASDPAPVAPQRERGGRGKKGSRGGKSGRSSFNFNDPEHIALTLYVSNLPHGVKESEIEAKFEEFGAVRAVQMPNPNYCFVHYVEKDGVETAMKNRPIKLNGEDLKVDKRRPNNRNKHADQGRGRGRGGRHYNRHGRGDSKVFTKRHRI